ncbi:protein FAM107B isoform X2 [Sphaeramia orbicularis]|uniref:protein FAM107B isoform X2 n=1 Tax=Sphaeramia orbicularis TaxID=375764 RepID=UPI00117FDBC5|nr:protein FAM107B-like isoform X2 [Sphaeramia orbicularis]
MGVTHGKKRDLQQFSAIQTNQNEHLDPRPELQAFTSKQQIEDESRCLITPQKPLNPFTSSKSHQELHRELRMSHRRRVSQEGKTELQQALEKRKWEQKMKARRDQEERLKSRLPLHQELLKRHQRLEKMEQKKEEREEPEFLQVKHRLRRTTMTDVGENN